MIAKGGITRYIAVRVWAVEEAGMLRDTRFLPALKEPLARLESEDAVYFRGSVQGAIAACEGRGVDDSPTLQ